MTGAAPDERRARLLRHLDQAAALTVVWGPVGFGKTALVEDWLAGRPTRAISLPAPGRHDEPASYWDGVATAMSRDVDMVVLDLPDALGDPDAWSRLADLRRDHPDVRVVATVRDAGFFWRHRVWDTRVTLITPADLTYTEVELTAGLSRADPPVRPRTARAFHRATAGQPVLVRLAEDVIRVFGRDLEHEREGALATLGTYIDHYVRTEILGRCVPPRLRRIALSAAVLHHITVGAIEALGSGDDGETDAGSVIAELEIAGLLRRMPTARDPYWVLPPGIRRSLLRIAAADGHTPVRELSASAARWFAGTGDPAEALRHATRGGDWRLAVEILADDWLDVAATRLDVLMRSLAALPDRVVESHPALHHARELITRMGSGARLPFRPSRFEEVPLEGIAARDSVEVALATGLLRSTLMRWVGNYDDALRDRAVLVDLATRIDRSRADGNGSGSESRRAIVWLHLGLAAQYRGSDAEAVSFLSHAVDTGLGGPGGAVVRLAAGQSALLEVVRGEVHRAQRWIDRDSAFHDRDGCLGAVLELPGRTAAALVAIERLDPDTAESELAELPDLGDMVENWAYVAYAHAQLDVLRRRPEVGLDRLQRMRWKFRRWLHPTSFAVPLLGAASMELRIAAGEAFDVVEEAERTREPMHPLVRVAVARAAFVVGNGPVALAHATAVGRRRDTAPRVRLDALLIEAAVRLGSGDVAAARVAFERACVLAADTGARRPFATLPESMLRELADPDSSDLPFAAMPVTGVYPAPAPRVTLTERESVVLAGLVRGDSLAQLAETLFVSPNTVKSQVRSLYRKLGVHSRSEAVEVARRRGLTRSRGGRGGPPPAARRHRP